MKNKNELESGFRINNIILLESDFKREVTVAFNNTAIEQNINFDVDVNIIENNIFVTE